MSKETDVSFLLNQLDDLKKRIERMQEGHSMTRKIAGYGLGLGITGLAIGAYLLIRHFKDGA
jgi:hypothetical protein|tara:strand:- start:690 stop:875 length:186 start_codon:yes stop_codon:yes gene_type:complete